MAKNWTSVAVSVETRERLKAFAASLVKAVEESRTPDPGINPDPKNPACVGLSMDDVIGILLDRAMNHRKREKRARKARQAAKTTEETRG